MEATTGQDVVEIYIHGLTPGPHFVNAGLLRASVDHGTRFKRSAEAAGKMFIQLEALERGERQVVVEGKVGDDTRIF